jgi:hypothetical protein
VIYEHEETWWNDIDRRQLLIRPQELSGNPTSSHLVASRKNGRRKLWIFFFPCEYFCLYVASDLLHAVKILRHGASGFTSLPKEGVLLFIAFKHHPEPWVQWQAR